MSPWQGAQKWKWDGPRRPGSAAWQQGKNSRALGTADLFMSPISWGTIWENVTHFLLVPYKWLEGKSVMTLELGETGCVQPVWARYCRIKITLHGFPLRLIRAWWSLRAARIWWWWTWCVKHLSLKGAHSIYLQLCSFDGSGKQGEPSVISSLLFGETHRHAIDSIQIQLITGIKFPSAGYLPLGHFSLPTIIRQ